MSITSIKTGSSTSNKIGSITTNNIEGGASIWHKEK